MSLKIKSKETTNLNDTDNSNQAIGGDGSIVRVESGATYTALDGGAINEAFSFASDFAERAIGFAGGAYAEAARSVEGAYKDASAGTEGMAIKYNAAIIAGLLLLGGLYVYRKGK